MTKENKCTEIKTTELEQVTGGSFMFFYTRYNAEKHRNDIEIDFIISNDSKTKFRISPIEVKSAKNYTATSLESFKEIYKKK